MALIMISLFEPFRVNSMPSLVGFVLVTWLVSSLVFVHLRLRKVRGLIQYSNPKNQLKQPILAKRSAEVDYTGVYPPLQDGLTENSTTSRDKVGYPAVVDLSTTSRPILKLDCDYRSASSSTYVFTGFSVDYINRLGDFPDYAKLSGVPLPSPIHDFNIDNAVPRPYRPFRWAYHQTMCE